MQCIILIVAVFCALPISAAAVTYYAYGDSITTGVGLSDYDNVYIMYMQRTYDPTATAYHTTDGGGKTSTWGLDHIGSHYSESAQYFFIFFGVNDYRLNVDAVTTADNLEKMYHYAQANGSVPVIGIPILVNNRFGSSNITRLQQYLDAKEIPYVKMFDALDRVPLNGVLDAYNGTNIPDGIHPDEAGHRLMGDYLWNYGINLTPAPPPVYTASLYDNFTTDSRAQYNYGSGFRWNASLQQWEFKAGSSGFRETLYRMRQFGYGQYSVRYTPVIGPGTTSKGGMVFGDQSATPGSLYTGNKYILLAYKSGSSNKLYLYRVTGGTATALKSATVPPWHFGQQYTLAVQWDADGKITASVDGSPVLQTSDTRYSAGYAGLYTHENLWALWDDLQIDEADAVPPDPPVAHFTADTENGPAPLQVQFTDTSTGNPTSWSWDFGDGGSSAQQSPAHIFNDVGTFTVRLTAGNAGGSDSTDKTIHVVLPDPPVADFTTDTTGGPAPLRVQFTDISTNTPTSWSWDFGDGGSSAQQSPAHIFNDVGTFTVRLTAGNAGGSNSTDKTIDVVVPDPPVADFTTDRTGGPAPLEVLFTDRSSNIPTTWTWDFGDGGSSTQQSPSHVYNDPGTFTVTLTAGNAGGSDTVTRTDAIEVSDAAVPFLDDFSTNSDASYNDGTGCRWNASLQQWEFKAGTSGFRETIFKERTFGYGQYSVRYTPMTGSGSNSKGGLVFGDQSATSGSLYTGSKYILLAYRTSSTNKLYLYRVTGGTATVLKYATVPPWIYGQQYALAVQWDPNGKITASLDGNTVFQVTDTSYAAGYTGMYTHENVWVLWDDLQVSEM